MYSPPPLRGGTSSRNLVGSPCWCHGVLCCLVAPLVLLPSGCDILVYGWCACCSLFFIAPWPCWLEHETLTPQYNMHLHLMTNLTIEICSTICTCMLLVEITSGHHNRIKVLNYVVDLINMYCLIICVISRWPLHLTLWTCVGSFVRSCRYS